MLPHSYTKRLIYNYASPSSADAYSVLQLTSNVSFELNFLCADMFPYADSKMMFVCP